MKALIQRDIRRRVVVRRDKNRRKILRNQARDVCMPLKSRYKAMTKLASLNRDGIKPRVRNRCLETGRSRGLSRDFKLSRTILRNRILDGSIPGVYKSSW